MTLPDPWTALRAHTAARIALGRAGDSLPTAEWLRFGVAHAMARDAVHDGLDAGGLAAALQSQGFKPVAIVESAAGDRATYLRRPDLGRRLSPRSAALLPTLMSELAGALSAAPLASPPAVLPPVMNSVSSPTPAGQPASAAMAVLIGDGLSARAVEQHALPLLLELRPRLEAQGQAIGCIAVAHQARVALGDEVAALLQAPAVLVLIGERPGLSSPDSLGAYLTWAPRVGCADAQRNCVSNIRGQGLGYAEAAHKIAWLLGAARRLGASGVGLKDESQRLALADGQVSPRPLLPGA